MDYLETQQFIFNSKIAFTNIEKFRSNFVALFLVSAGEKKFLLCRQTLQK